MKQLVMVFVFLISTTFSSWAIADDVAISTTTSGDSSRGVMFSWVVKDGRIHFCSALDWEKGIAHCIKATVTNSK